jgi:hypothetical protein
MAHAAAPVRHLRRWLSPPPTRQRTDTPGVYRRDNTYTYTYRDWIDTYQDHIVCRLGVDARGVVAAP